MKYNPATHLRRSVRLKGYDYSRPGAYFITTCVQNREHLFGKIETGRMITNANGDIVSRIWFDLINHYSYIGLDEFVVMPNHFHGIIMITGDGGDAGANPPGNAATCCCPKSWDALKWFHQNKSTYYVRQQERLFGSAIIGNTLSVMRMNSHESGVT